MEVNDFGFLQRRAISMVIFSFPFFFFVIVRSFNWLDSRILYKKKQPKSENILKVLGDYGNCQNLFLYLLTRFQSIFPLEPYIKIVPLILGHIPQTLISFCDTKTNPGGRGEGLREGRVPPIWQKNWPVLPASDNLSSLLDQSFSPPPLNPRFVLDN